MKLFSEADAKKMFSEADTKKLFSVKEKQILSLLLGLILLVIFIRVAWSAIYEATIDSFLGSGALYYSESQENEQIDGYLTVNPSLSGTNDNSQSMGEVFYAVVNIKNKFIFVDAETKKLYLFSEGLLLNKYPIASGKPESPSPIGTWKIIGKSDWGEGFGGRWMGFNVPWGKYGIHGTTSPFSIGWASSHGCIRMYNRDVKQLYKMVPAGTDVIISGGYLGPFGKALKALKPGDRGADVFAVQKKLKSLGYFNGWISGIYNDEMKNAVFRFQKKAALYVENTLSVRALRKMGFYEFE